MTMTDKSRARMEEYINEISTLLRAKELPSYLFANVIHFCKKSFEADPQESDDNAESDQYIMDLIEQKDSEHRTELEKTIYQHLLGKHIESKLKARGEE